MRIVLRHRADGALTDALGPLVALDASSLTVRTRRGPVRVLRDDVVAAKEVPPAPTRRGAPHRVVSMTDLQRVMVDGMPPLRSAWVGEWLLRESAGYTGRANSALPLGDPGLPLLSAVASVSSWYADRGQVPLLQVSGPSGFAVESDPSGGAAVSAGWTAFQRTLVMTAPVAGVRAAASSLSVSPSVLTVASSPSPSEAWWSGSTAREQQHRGTAAAIFDLVDDGEYVVLSGDSGSVLAVGRAAYARGWAGVFSVHVPPEHRRRGLARQVMGVAMEGALRRGMRSAYLQVSADNDAAVALYRSLGFEIHHEYYHLRAPT